MLSICFGFWRFVVGLDLPLRGCTLRVFVTDLAVDLNELFTNMFHARHQTVTIYRGHQF